MTTGHVPLDERSDEQAVMSEVRRLCSLHGDPEAAKFYAWSDQGLWRVNDRSEPGLVDFGMGRADMQSAVELDVAAHVRLRRRREAVEASGDIAWSLVVGRVTRRLLAHVWADPLVAVNHRDADGPARGDVRLHAVTHRRGCVLARVQIGIADTGVVDFDAFEDRSEILVSGLSLPATMLASLAGEPLARILPHPLLDDLELTVLSATCTEGTAGQRGDTILRLPCLWEPLVDDPRDRPWLMPLPLPRYR